MGQEAVAKCGQDGHHCGTKKTPTTTQVGVAAGVMFKTRGLSADAYSVKSVGSMVTIARFFWRRKTFLTKS